MYGIIYSPRLRPELVSPIVRQTLGGGTVATLLGHWLPSGIAWLGVGLTFAAMLSALLTALLFVWFAGSFLFRFCTLRRFYIQ